jgi:hypothetical protein
VSKEVPVSRSPTISDTPASVTAARAVVHLARVVAVLSVAIQAALVAIEVSWVLEGRLPFGDVVGDKGFPLALSVGGALAVWWLSARVLASTRTALDTPGRWP